jgi:hypothetical protein
VIRNLAVHDTVAERLVVRDVSMPLVSCETARAERATYEEERNGNSDGNEKPPQLERHGTRAVTGGLMT